MLSRLIFLCQKISLHNLRSNVSELQDYSSHNTNILMLGLSPKPVQSYTRKTLRYLALYSGTLNFQRFFITVSLRSVLLGIVLGDSLTSDFELPVRGSA